MPTYPQSWGLKPAVVRAPGRKVSVFSPLSEIGWPVSGWVSLRSVYAIQAAYYDPYKLPAFTANKRACKPAEACFTNHVLLWNKTVPLVLLCPYSDFGSSRNPSTDRRVSEAK